MESAASNSASSSPAVMSLVRRAFEFWPYLFIAVSIAGFIYLGLNAPH
jgi:hypothetical protein